MKHLTNLIIGTLFVAVLAVLSALPAAGQDPTKVDAKHYKVEFENEWVRVLRASYGPNEKSVMHQHPEGLAISLSDTNGKFTLGDGKTENRTFKAGQVRWTPAETHMPENTGGKPFEVILVELKGGSGGGPMPAAADDSVKVSPKFHKVEFENEKVRVVRSVIGPHEKTGMHAHPGNIVVFLTDARVRSTSADGKTEEVQGKARQVTWRAPLKHDAENMGDRPMETLVVELKGQ
jgi:quercetin dioxygenase-like cupin family protein